MTNPHYQRSSDAIFSEVGEDIVALHIPRGHCYGMERVSAAIWGLLSDPIDLDAICVQLLQRYDVEPDRCRAEVETLLDQLHREGLIELVSP
jgi:hypothetical protein